VSLFIVGGGSFPVIPNGVRNLSSAHQRSKDRPALLVGGVFR
jgi:hypothetical protein